MEVNLEKIEMFRKEMELMIEKYGVSSKEVLVASQRLDEAIAAYLRDTSTTANG